MKDEVTIDKKDLQAVLDAVLRLQNENQIFYVHVKAFEDRLTKSEEALFARTGQPMQDRFANLENRVALQETHVTALESSLRDRVEEMVARLLAVERRKPPTVELNLESTPQLAQAMENLRRYTNSGGEKQ